MMLPITGIFGALLVVAFLGFMVAWVKAPPLIVIVLIVVGLMIYDLYKEIRASRSDNA